MNYSIYILRSAQKSLALLPNGQYEQIKNSIRGLSQNPRPTGCKKLIGREGWRIRVGRFWVIYEINDQNKVITILHIGHRKDIYR